MLAFEAIVFLCCFGFYLSPTRAQQQQQQQSNLRPNDGKVRELRNVLMYPYHKDEGIYDIHWGNPQLQQTHRLTMPFFGFSYNYTWVNLHGYVAFSKSPAKMDAPFQFPIDGWPNIDDPAFIGPFFARADIGFGSSGTQEDEYPPGVYAKIIVNIGAAADLDDLQYQLDLREVIRLDVQEGMVGAADFNPKHVIIVTWRNVTFGGSQNPKLTNTYQLVLTTDEIRTYAIFNYERIVWHTSVNAGGNHEGIGGHPAFVGFNAGNGTRAYEYKPFSQGPKISDLAIYGFTNGFPGRHMFRIDEEILQGSCNYEPEQSPPLVMSPDSGHMLGGTVVNITGPCFDTDQKTVKIKFHDQEISCPIYSRNMATCITPAIFSAGYVEVIGRQSYSSGFQFTNKFYIENPMVATESVRFQRRDFINKLDDTSLEIEWSRTNLTWNSDALVSISLWGYREYAVKPDLVYITTLVDSTKNSGQMTIELTQFENNDDGWKRDFIFGLIQINTTVSIVNQQTIVPRIWSRPIPLGWYFHKQWIRHYGSDWAAQFCKQWDVDDRRLRNFAHEVPRCPCNLKQALSDKGRYIPDFGCDRWGNPECYGNQKILHCVRSGQPTLDGGGQQCCYGQEEDLVMNSDMKEGGIPSRAHPFGIYPFDDSTKVPGLSHWYHDQSAYFTCCGWQSEMSESCYQFKWRRASQDCIGYQPPNASVVFGDPHVITFDNFEYTFNGKGEFALLTVHDKAHTLDVQGRFEQIIDVTRKLKLPATYLTSVATKDNSSSTVEIQLRPSEARWRYRLNVLVDGKRVYFDRPAHKIQSFKGVTVYVPSYIHNQSHVIATFQSGAGVEAIENNGYMAARVYLPKTFMNITKGLMGNWSNDPTDDLVLSSNEELTIPITTTNDRLHRDFGNHWMVTDSGDPLTGKQSLFFHENHRSSSTYNEADFQPNFKREPDFLSNMSITEENVRRTCGSRSDPLAYQCRFDYLITENKAFAQVTKYSADSFRKMKGNDLKIVTTCGALETPRHGTKSTNRYVTGTKVNLACEKGYVLEGEPIRWCYPSGEWSWAEYGVTRCLPEDSYYASKAGITSGIVLGILIPVVIGSICLFAFVVSKGNSETDSPRGGYRGESQKMERVRTTSDSHEVDTKQKNRETQA